jgi:hypothetical protein
MDDLDREIKLVQLQRERLALEREMAFRGIGGTVKNVVQLVGWAVVTPFKGLSRFFARWWRVLFSIAVAVGCLGAVTAWVTHSQQEAQRLAEERWYSKFSAYADKECPLVACSTSWECMEAESKVTTCRLQARSRYEQFVPLPKSK